MEITTAQINFFKKDGFRSIANENIKHIKVLPYLSIVQSVEGSYDIALGNGEQQQTGDGGFFIAPSGVQQHIVHHVNKKSGTMTCRWLFIDIEINKVYKLDTLYLFPTILDETVKKKMNDLFDSLFSTDDLWENYSCCYRIIGLLLQNAKSLQNNIDPRIQASVEYIKKNQAQTISINDLARAANMSESNFYAAFKKHFGSSPIAYLNHYRLSLAAEFLRETNATVGEIAYRVGIKDPLYFSKLFKRTHGISPKEYRILHTNK